MVYLLCRVYPDLPGDISTLVRVQFPSPAFQQLQFNEQFLPALLMIEPDVPLIAVLIMDSDDPRAHDGSASAFLDIQITQPSQVS
jgi:hypothetical protein